MKNTAPISLLCLLLIGACRKDEGAAPDPTPDPVTYDTHEFAPYTVGSWWAYSGVSIDPVTLVETPNGTLDTLRVVQDSVVDGQSYARLVGERFGVFPVDRLVRVDGPRLVDQHGNVLMDVTAGSDTLSVSPGTFPIDSVATVLQSQDLGLSTPAGAFTSEHMRDVVFFMAPGFLSPLHEKDHHVRDVGVAVYTSFYASSGVRIEMRLSGYHIEL